MSKDDGRETPPSRSADKYIIRFPDGMRQSLKQHAEANHRTLNQEILLRIEAASRDPEFAWLPPVLKAKLEELAKRSRRTLTQEIVARLEESTVLPGEKLMLEDFLKASMELLRDMERDIKSEVKALRNDVRKLR